MKDNKCYGVVYVHINRLNGKKYVGQTEQKPERRWRKGDWNNNSGYKGSTIFLRALKKYNWLNFESIVLASASNQVDLDWLEEYFIKYYNSLAPTGYNSVGYAMGKVVFTEEVRNKIRDKALAWQNRGPACNRTEHTTIDGIDSKECTRCHITKPITEYGKHARKAKNGNIVGDGYNWYCRECHNSYRRRYKYKPVSEAQVAQSYEERGKNLSTKLKDKYKDPEARRNLSLSYNTEYHATDVNTGKTIVYLCGYDVEAADFKMVSVCPAVKNGTAYKGYRWKKVIKR